VVTTEKGYHGTTAPVKPPSALRSATPESLPPDEDTMPKLKQMLKDAKAGKIKAGKISYQ
jgi:hypothetical protein